MVSFIKQWGIFFVCGAFLFGIALGTFFDVETRTLVILFVFSLFVGVIIRRKCLVLAIFCGFCIGVLRIENWQESVVDSDTKISEIITGYVSVEPDGREQNTRYTITTDQKINILVTVGKYPEYQYGDYLEIQGQCEEPQDFETDTNRIFQYQEFLQKDGILFICKNPKIVELEDQTKGNIFIRMLLGFKSLLVFQMNHILPNPQSSLLGGLLLGTKSSLGPEILEQFRVTGVIHIVVLSGFNVTIVAEAVMRVLAFMGVRAAALLGSLSIICFMFLTGAGATVVRASLMALFVIAARVLGREAQIVRLLVIAATLMVFQSPYILIFDPSFQLSFLATVGLILFVPVFEKYCTWIPKTGFDFRGLFVASLATQVMVLPLLIWMSGEVSVISLAVNVLVLWIIPLTMLLGFVSIVASAVSYTLALPIITLTYTALAYILWIVEKAAALPFTTVQFF